MWLEVVLFTGTALSACGSAWFALRASHASDAATHSEARLLTLRGRVVGLEEAQERLLAMHRKLAGRIYADEYHGNLPAAAPRADNPQNRVHECDNYALAQVDGPTSAAAQCQCAYCLRMRAERDAFRADAARARRNGATVRQDDSD